MAKISSKREKLAELEEQIEQLEKEINSDFGKKMIDKLDLNYEDLETAKDRNQTIEYIINALDSNDFTTSENEDNESLHNVEYQPSNSENMNDYDREIT